MTFARASRGSLLLTTTLALSLASIGIRGSGRDTQPPSTATPQTDVYVVPFSHLDLYWAGTREECLSRGNRIITKAMDFAIRYPEFRFLLEDDVFVANYVDTHRGSPELDRLKELVKQERIEISPKWAAILQNLPRGEAWVRNVLLGKRYAREAFGVDPLVANLGDLPGYTSQFPQILARSGVPYMVMTRMGPADKSLFYYKALDGSKVLTWNTLKGYGWGTFITSKTLSDDEKRTRFNRDLADVIATTRSPVLMHWGTDLWAPDDGLVEAIDSFKTPSAHLIFATPTQFFHRAEQTSGIPEISGEIPHAWGNILSSIVHLWPPTIAATDALLTAEKFAAINDALGYAPYPARELDDLWKKVLESMDHNNFGQGGEIGDARKLEYAETGIVRGGEILRESLRNIAERVRHPIARSMSVVVFNPLSWTRDDLVGAHVSLYGDAAPGDIADYRKAVRLVDETGASVPFSIERSSGTVSRALELIFIARGVPSLGYKTYFVVPAEKPEVFPKATDLTLDADPAAAPKRTIGSDTIANEFYSVTVDRATGRVTVFDKDLGRIVAKDMEIVASEERGGDSLSKEAPSGRIIVNTIGRVDIDEHNAVRTVVRIDGNLGGVPVTQKLVLYRGLKRVDLENTVEWPQGRLMKIEQTFPYEHPDARIEYGVPFGAVSASDVLPNSQPRFTDEIGRDAWMAWRQIQDWVFAGNDDWGLTVAADRQIVTLASGVIRAGMLRGTYSPVGITVRDKPFLKQMPPAGRYVFHYSVSSGKGNWAVAKSYRAGMALNNPLVTVSPADDLSAKSLPVSQSFCSTTADNVVISALKRSETGRALILRAFETEGSHADVSINCLGSQAGFREVNLLEEDLPSGDQTRLSMRPYEIRTVKLRTDAKQRRR